MNKIQYITYQSFPSNKANTIQSMSNIKYLCKHIQNVELIFPIREKISSSSKDVLKKFYFIPDNLKIKGIKHNYPFGKINFLNKYSYLISHYLWAKQVTRDINLVDSKSIIFTRSDWIFYFLSKKGYSVTFECHQLSKVRKIIIKKSIKYENSKIIFLNSLLFRDSNIDLTRYKNKLTILHNGVDTEIFEKDIQKNKNQIIFLGNLSRFNEDRNIKFIIECFEEKSINKNFKLKIIGGSRDELEKLKSFTKRLDLNKSVEVIERQSRANSILNLQKSDIGLLINSSENLHSTRYTSPLKYFEYLFGGLKILAVDFESHHDLPHAENIHFFQEDNKESFLNTLQNINQGKTISSEDLFKITLEFRVKQIIKFMLT
jgi:glycosyltransferase involved in cell wall biosynthesis